MCRPVGCSVCGKTTWAGCGEHVDQVKAQVPDEQWCPGHPEQQGAAGSETQSHDHGGIFSRLFSR